MSLPPMMNSEIKRTEFKMNNIKTTLFALLIAELAAQCQASNSFNVEITGKGKPMILIPGLTCSCAVWNEVVQRYSKKYECHTLSLAGFAGAPPVQHKGNFLETVMTFAATSKNKT